MPGFVDVTGWTSEEVRRLGHADDCDDVDFQPRCSFKRKPYAYSDSIRPASAKYTVSDVWAAAWCSPAPSRKSKIVDCYSFSRSLMSL